jgi:hypothetical protein
MEEFRGADKALLDRLDILQKTLGEKTQANNAMIAEMKRKASRRTQDTLLAVQEMGQTRTIRQTDETDS